MMEKNKVNSEKYTKLMLSGNWIWGNVGARKIADSDPASITVAGSVFDPTGWNAL